MGVGGKGRGWRGVYGEDSWDPVTRGRVVDPTSWCAEQGASIYFHYESTFSHCLISDQSMTINDQCPLITNCASSALLQSGGTCGASGTSGTSGTQQ